MIAKWKLQREINRLGEQVQAVVSYPLEPFRKWQHDKSFHDKIRLSDGNAPLTNKVAIFLVYQPRGILGSAMLTCEHLRSKGYSVLLVSNAAINDADLERLKEICWKICVRPNFGYDFGGYRDGIRLVNEAGIVPEALVILNDSIWWPIFPNDTVLERMEQSGADVVGTIMHQKTKRKFSPSQRQPFLESYFFWFNQKAFQSKAFQRFFKDYRISSIKYNAVHRGERRLTGALSAGGLKVLGLFSRESLVARLREQGATEIRNALVYGAYIDPDFQNAAKTLLSQQDQENWEERAVSFIESSTVRRGFHASFSYASVKILGATFLKKAPAQANGSIHHVMRQKVIDAVEQGDLPAMLPVVHTEILRRQAEGAAAVAR